MSRVCKRGLGKLKKVSFKVSLATFRRRRSRREKNSPSRPPKTPAPQLSAGPRKLTTLGYAQCKIYNFNNAFETCGVVQNATQDLYFKSI